MYAVSVTLLVSHLEMSPLKAVKRYMNMHPHGRDLARVPLGDVAVESRGALEHLPPCWVTLLTSHLEMSPLKALA